MKILVATEKPFAAVAVNGIREVIEAAGAELVLLEKYTEKAQLLAAVADVDGIIIRSDKVDAEVLDAMLPYLKEEDKIAELRYILARKEAKIKALEMQNELMRDFLSLTGRK